jgi:uncharacterized protein (DUF1499 family)
MLLSFAGKNEASMSGNWLLRLIVMIVGCSGTRPSQIGVTGGRLAPCPDTPNCVSSQSEDKRQAIEPLRYEGAAQTALQELTDVIRGMKRARITTARERYLHAEFTSLLFRFVDDVEFLLDDNSKTIHVRSASRVGYSDLGVNRKRVEAIRSRFDALRKEERVIPGSDRSR